MEIDVFRSLYNEKSTRGVMVIDGVFFGYTLEDKVRPAGVKIKGETAIPAGRYAVTVNMSNRFKREMTLLLAVPGFDGVRVHGGNTDADTEGCILVAKNPVNKSTIQGTLEKEFTAKVKAAIGRGEAVYINVVNSKEAGF